MNRSTKSERSTPMNDFLNFLVTGWYWILIAIVGLIILVKFIPRYKIAPPDTALIMSVSISSVHFTILAAPPSSMP